MFQPARTLFLLTVFTLAAALAFDASPAAAKGPSGRYWESTDGCEFNPLIRSKVDAVAERYYKKTKRKLLITSAHRSPGRQANALYKMLLAGGTMRIYRDQSLARPIADAYLEGRRKKWPRSKTIAAMQRVIEGQVREGKYLSRHMHGRAFDVRIRGLTRRQQEAFRQAVREVGGMKILVEKKPPHFHVEILRD